MASLQLELEVSKGRWATIGTVKPGDPPGSISDNQEDGSRDIYLFECARDGSKSTLYRSKGGIDGVVGPNRVVNMADGAEIVKELMAGEPYEMEVKPDRCPEPKKVRFTHM
jgi:hypothetical protein